MKTLLRTLLVALALAPLAAIRADSPFEVLAVSSSPAFNHTQDYGSFPTLVSDVLKNQGNFSALAGSNSFFAAIKFLGVSNALQVNFNDSGIPGPTRVSVSLNSPGVGNVINHSFSGPDRPDVEEQIKNFFLNNGSAQVGNFLAAIAKQSAIAVTDGNPN